MGGNRKFSAYAKESLDISRADFGDVVPLNSESEQADM